MSFDKIRFTYIPPPTLPTAPRAALAAVEPVTDSAAAEFGSPQAAASNAAQLIRRLEDLRRAARYLDSAVRMRTRGLGVEFDLASDPELGMALNRIYATDEPPPVVDMAMYRQVLEADIGVLRVDLVAPPATASLVVSPVQRMDLSLAARRFEKALAAEGSFRRQLPLLLRPLLGDIVIFDQWESALRDYPVLRRAQASAKERAGGSSGLASAPREQVDVSEPLAATLSEYLDSWEIAFGRTFELLAAADPVDLALPEIVSLFNRQPRAELARLSQLFRTLTSFFHVPRMRDLTDSLVNIVFPRLLSELGGFRFSLDRLQALAFDPAHGFTDSLGGLLAQIRRLGVGGVVDGGLTGVLRRQAGPADEPLTSLADTGLSAGLAVLGASLGWALREGQRRVEIVQESMEKALARRLSESGERLEILGHLRSLSSLVGLVDAFLSQGESGQLSSLDDENPVRRLEAFSRLLGDLRAESGASFALEGEELVITPAELPAVPEEVDQLFRRGGVTRIATRDLVHVKLGVLHA